MIQMEDSLARLRQDVARWKDDIARVPMARLSTEDTRSGKKE
jgi:hypothetical protein